MTSSYLQPPDPRLFAIDEFGTAWSWVHASSTAMIDQQLALILEQFAIQERGIPPVVPIMCIASAQRGWEGADCWRERLRVLPAKGLRASQFDSVIRFLEFVSSLSPALRSGVESTVAILTCGLAGKREWFFEADSSQSKEICRYLRLRPDERPHVAAELSTRRRDNTRCRRAWETLVELAKSVDQEEKLAVWRRAGLSDLPKQAEVDESLTQKLESSPPSIQDVVKELERDPLHASMASLSQSVGSMISLPRKPADPDQLPVGGVSDITNRGSPERLLSNELAADPMVMLARIANGQALYMRRETPPAPQPSHRDVLIESSIRCWGIRRVYLAAIALGIGLSEESRKLGKPRFHFVDGEDYGECDFTDRESVLGFLERLDISRDPTVGLEKYFENRDRSEGGLEAAPLLLVTSSTGDDPRFEELLLKLPLPILVMDVAVDGQVRLRRVSNQGIEALQELQLELSPATGKDKDYKIAGNSGLPVFLGLQTPPLLFAPPNRATYFHLEPASERTWLVTADRRLLCFSDARRGGRQLCDSLPGSRVLCMHSANGKVSGVVAADSGEHCLFLVDENGTKRVHHLSSSTPDASYYLSDRFLLALTPDAVSVINKDDGRIIEQQRDQRRHMGLNYTMDDMGGLWMHGDESPGDWHRVGKLSGDGKTTACVVVSKLGVPCAISADLQSIDMGDFEEDPEVSKRLHRNFRVYRVPLPGTRFHVLQSSRDRSAWLIQAHGTGDVGVMPSAFHVHLPSGQVEELHNLQLATALAALDRRAAASLKPRSIRKRITAVRLTSSGLTLRGGRRRYVKLRAANQTPRRLVLESVAPGEGEDVEFEKPFAIQSPDGSRCWTLRKAQLPGCTCWLDSRGLLHLTRDDDPHELTLILVDTHVAGWFSSTGCFGPCYFHATQSMDSDAANSQNRAGDVIPVPSEVLQWLASWK